MASISGYYIVGKTDLKYLLPAAPLVPKHSVFSRRYPNVNISGADTETAYTDSFPLADHRAETVGIHRMFKELATNDAHH